MSEIVGKRPSPAKERRRAPVPDQRQVVLAEKLGDDLMVTRRCSVLDRLDDQTP